MELLPCMCGGRAREIRSGLGCYVYCERCGYETNNYNYIDQAQQMWNLTMTASEFNADLSETLYARLNVFSFRGKQIPEHMHSGIVNYLVHRLQPGDFLTGVLTNDLGKAVAHADDTNLWLIPVYVAFFYNEAPASCWGSIENVENFLKQPR